MIDKKKDIKMDRIEYDKIIDECRSISISKNNDYGDASLTKFKEEGIIIRLNDKMERLINLNKISVAHVTSECLEDTALDMINYLIYLVMMVRGKLK